MRSVMCAVAVLVAGVAFAEDRLVQPELRQLGTTGVKFDDSKSNGRPKPVEIKSADELAKSLMFVDDADRAAIKKQVDFSKEKLVVFAWSGSGGDKLGGALTKDGKVAEFTYKVGLTDDLRHHAYAFAVPKDATVEFKE